MSIHVSLDAMDFSQSFASRRQRPSHAKVRSAIAAELLFFITYGTVVHRHLIFYLHSIL